jgi:hypothetical protein
MAENIPETIKRSEKHAEATWEKAHDSAVETYGEGEAAHRVAFAALKHSYKKVGDHWERKAHRGPSDPQAARGPTTRKKSTDPDTAPTARGKVAKTASEARSKAKQAAAEDREWRREEAKRGGRTRDELYAEAKRRGVKGRSKMSKADSNGRWRSSRELRRPAITPVEWSLPYRIGRFAVYNRGMAKTYRLVVRLDEEHARMLEEICRIRGMTKSAVIRDLINRAYDELQAGRWPPARRSA